MENETPAVATYLEFIRAWAHVSRWWSTANKISTLLSECMRSGTNN